MRICSCQHQTFVHACSIQHTVFAHLLQAKQQQAQAELEAKAAKKRAKRQKKKVCAGVKGLVVCICARGLGNQCLRHPCCNSVRPKSINAAGVPGRSRSAAVVFRHQHVSPMSMCLDACMCVYLHVLVPARLMHGLVAAAQVMSTRRVIRSVTQHA